MNDPELPIKRPIGTQLGLGIEGPSIYLSTLNHTRHNDNGRSNLWHGQSDNAFLDAFMNFKIVSSDVLVKEDQSSNRSISSEYELTDILSDNEIVESDVLEEEELEAFNEHVRDSLISKLQWGKLTPSISSPNLQIYNNVEDTSYNNMYTSHGNSPASFHYDYFPRDLVKNITKSDSSLSLSSKNLSKDPHITTANIIDPTIGDTFIIGKIQTSFDLRNYIDHHEVIAYSSGRSNSKLKLSIIEQNKLKSPDKYPTYALNQQSRIVEIDLHSRIKSIKIPLLAKTYTRHSDIIAVITDRALTLIKIKSIDNHNSKIKYQLFDSLDFAKLGDYPFADVTFNPMNIQQFAVIDTKGNWVLGYIPISLKHNTSLSLDPEIRGTIYDPEALSLWKHISWSSHNSRLLLLDESKIIEIDFDEKWQSEIVQAKSWSKLIDFKEIDEDYKVLLTSREIIILNTNNQLDDVSRVLSWKHDLDSTDRTHRIFIQKIDMESKKLYFIYVVSKKHDKVYLRGFSITNNSNSIQILNGSSIFKLSDIPNGIQTLAFVEESKELYDEEFTININIFGRALDSGTILHFVAYNDEDISDSVNISHVNLENITESSTNLDNVPSEIQYIYLNINDKLKRKKEISYSREHVDDVEVFEDYGYRLSEAMNNYIYHDISVQKDSQPLLSKLTEPPHHIDNFEEFMSLLNQFFDHYKSENIIFTDLSKIFKYFINDNIQNIDVFYNKLLQCWELTGSEAEFYTREIVKYVIWNTLRFSKKQSYDKLNKSTYESLNDSCKYIIDDWDREEINDDYSNTISTIPLNSQPQFSLNTQSQIPTIKSSQNKITKRRSNKTSNVNKPTKSPNTVPSSQRDSFLQSSLPASMTPAFTLMGVSNHSTELSQFANPTSSQARGSQRSKKKKKKIGGFS